MTQRNDSGAAPPLLSRAKELLGALVAYDTTSRNSNLALVEYVETLLRAHGIASQRLENADGTKASLIARIGPDAPGGIILSGHTDVVPVDDQIWATPPFTLSERNGHWHGRGTADMKGFIACCLALLPEFCARPLKRPIYYVFSYDEEVGCLAAPALAAHVAALNCAPALAIIGEPTEMQVVQAHKGVQSFETTVTGKEGHSSHPERGANAVHAAARLVTLLMDMAEEEAQKPASAEALLFDPPYATLHVGVISGGAARNIIPGECHFKWEIRPLPDTDVEALLARFHQAAHRLEEQMQARFPQCRIITRALSRVPGLREDACANHLHTALSLAQRNGAQAVSFATEAGIFQAHGIPAVICGPGSIAQAHQPDEHIAAAQIATCLEFLHRVGDFACTG